MVMTLAVIILLLVLLIVIWWSIGTMITDVQVQRVTFAVLAVLVIVFAVLALSGHTSIMVR